MNRLLHAIVVAIHAKPHKRGLGFVLWTISALSAGVDLDSTADAGSHGWYAVGLHLSTHVLLRYDTRPYRSEHGDWTRRLRVRTVSTGGG